MKINQFAALGIGIIAVLALVGIVLSLRTDRATGSQLALAKTVTGDAGAMLGPNVFRYDSYDATNHVLYFTQLASGLSRDVALAPQVFGGSTLYAGALIYSGRTYAVRLGTTSGSQITLDTDLDGQYDVSLSPPQTVSLVPPQTVTYDDYDAVNRVALFTVDGVSRQVAVDTGGLGTLVVSGYSYGFQVLKQEGPSR